MADSLLLSLVFALAGCVGLLLGLSYRRNDDPSRSLMQEPPGRLTSVYRQCKRVP